MGGAKKKTKASAAVSTAPIKEDSSNYELARDRLISELAAALKEGDVRGMMKVTYFVDGLTLAGYPKFHEYVMSSTAYTTKYEKSNEPYDKWRDKINVGDTVDTLKTDESMWYEAKVLELDRKADTMKVHYNGWSSAYDTVISISESILVPQNTFTVGKKKPVKAQPRYLDEEAALPEQTTTTTATTQSSAQSAAEIVPEVLDRTSRRRSRVDPATAGTTDNGAASEAQNGEEKLKNEKPKEEKDLNDWICGICGWLEAADGSDLVLCEAFCRRSFHLGCMRGKMVLPKADEAQWYCVDCRAGQHECFLCKQRGADNLEVHKCGNNACGKYYHQVCLAGAGDNFIVPPMTVSVRKDVNTVVPTTPPASATTTSAASAAITSAVPAPVAPMSPDTSAAAGKKGRGRPKASTSVGDAMASPSASASSSAATACAAAVDNTPRSTRGVKLDYRALNASGASPSASATKAASVVEVDPAVAEAAALQAAQEAQYAELERTTGHLYYEIKKLPVKNALTFKCPQHYCYNCYEFYGSANTSDINKCNACARAYHVNCIPPGSRFNSVCLLCPCHPDDPLPSHEMRMDPNTKRPKGTANMFTQFWEQLAIPDVLPNANDPFDNHFKLQQHVRDDVAGAAAPFTVISKNDYSFMAGKNNTPKFVPEVRCECKIDCDENCLNRILRIECCDTKIKTAGESGDMVICNVGAGCTNRALQKHKCPKTEPFREFKMGFGLRAKEHIYEGQLVMEYVGEVIDHAEVQRRMTSQRELTPGDKDFYIMELDNGVFVDGKFRGSTSRFINHSCDPNCELQRWVVKGMPRIGIFAIRDIAPGEALSYDYQFDTKEDEAFKCYCGTEKCRGTMAPKKKKAILYDANGRPQSREERLRLMHVGKSKEQALSRENLIEAEWARSYTGKCVPGDPINEIKNGPIKASLIPARDAHVLLCRAVKRSTNFFQRNEMQLKRQRLYELSTALHHKGAARSSRGQGSRSSGRSSAKASAGAGAGAGASTDGEDATTPGLMLEEEDN